MRKTESAEIVLVLLGGILQSFIVVLCLMLTCALGIVLIPYNVARATHWILEKVCEGLAGLIGWLEDLTF